MNHDQLRSGRGSDPSGPGSEKAVALTPGEFHAVTGTEGGKAASADLEITFSVRAHG